MRLSIPAVAALAAVASALSEPSIKCYENDRLCLTSFVWCDRGKGNALDCFYPPGTRPLGVETATAAVFRDRKHSLSWTGSFLPTGEPVELAWLFAPIDSDDVQRLWAMNVTGTDKSGSVELDFDAIFDDFPNEYTNMTRAEAIVAASHPTGLMRFEQIGTRLSVWTDQFVVVGPAAREVAEAADGYAAARRSKDLRLGLGIGLGVGIPLVIALVWLAAKPPKFLSRRKGGKPMEGDE